MLRLLLTFFVFAISWDSHNLLVECHQTPPHIILIEADDMGFDDVSYRGSNEFLTPNIDALAYHGRILDRLYAPAICTPSRSALLTGRYPIHTGTQHFVISNEEPWSLPTNVTTLAELLQQSAAGYATHLVGKWHLGFGRAAYTPTRRGFDHHYGYWGGFIDYYRRRSRMPLPEFNDLGYDFRRDGKVECSDMGRYVTDLLTDEAERVIRGHNASSPLFLWLAHLAPHTGNEEQPLQAPQDVVNTYGHIGSKDRRTYAAMVDKLDESVGRVIQALEEANLLANSIVIFHSDNGAPSVGLFANTGSNWPFRGQKHTPWEGGVRVGGAIWSPRLEVRQQIYRQPMYVGDFLPTLCEAAGIKLPADLHVDGISHWSRLVGEEDTGRRGPLMQRDIVHYLDDVDGVAALMRGQWKYVNGTTQNGTADNVLTYRELDDLDPRAQRYSRNVRRSLVSRVLRPYDRESLSTASIQRLRSGARVNCGSETVQRSCNPLVEECLFDLAADPCEQNNLRYERQYAGVLQEMRDAVEQYRRSAWPVRNVRGQQEYLPTRHQCTWTTFLEEPPSGLVNCTLTEMPCSRAL